MNATGRRQNRPLIVRMVGVGLSAVFLVAIAAGAVYAEGPLSGFGGISPFVGNGVIVGGGYPFRASTPAESFARGAADLIRAQGEFNRNTSEAAINWQEARARDIVNDQAAVEAYFKMRKMNRDYRAAERGPRPTQEDYERYVSALRPDPLSPSELDTLTGQVRWPILLRAEKFASLRAKMEELLDRWATSRNLNQPESFGTEQHLAVRRVTRAIEDELRDDVHDLPSQDYSASKRFLRSLEYQVLQPESPSVSVADAR